MLESITGQISDIRHHKTSIGSDCGNKFLIAQFFIDEGEKTGQKINIKGEMNSVVYGWRYNLFGTMVDTKYGPTFQFASFAPIVPKSGAGIADYLSRHVPDIGPVRSRAIADHFGDDTLTVLRTDPGRVKEVDGISDVISATVREFFESDNSCEIDPEAYSRLYDLLAPIRPPRRIINSLIRNFGSNAPQFITENPYSLMDYPGMGWIRVDKFACEILKYDRSGLERHKRAVLEVMARNSEQGHTRIDLPSIRVECSTLLGMSLSKEAVPFLENNGYIIIDESGEISSCYLFDSECGIATEIKRILDASSPLEFEMSPDGFEGEQARIPEMIGGWSIGILSGGAGVGKSFSVANIIKNLYNNGLKDIAVVAPTGKAAKRNKELIAESLPGIQIPCTTIHRALGVQMNRSNQDEEGIPEREARVNRGRESWSFLHDRDNPMEFSYFILDETGTSDVPLTASFLRAIPDGSRLLFVGDHNQLQSVGPGAVLRDLMDSGVPQVILDTPRRNAGTIPILCQMIRHGKFPDPKKLASPVIPESNWTHVEVQDDSKILTVIRQIHENYIAKFGRDRAKAELQVVSPEKKGILGCNNLNITIAETFGGIKPESFKLGDEHFTPTFRVGDKVIRDQNGSVEMLIDADRCSVDDLIDVYGVDRSIMIAAMIEEGEVDLKHRNFQGTFYAILECDVVNGDIGEVIALEGSGAGAKVFVRFSNPDRLCMLPLGDSRISLAYAITAHKIQGSSSPVIITPLSQFYWNPKTNTGLYSRELIYTICSRPTERLITVGRINEMYKAIGRVTIGNRRTRLASMLKKEKATR